MTEEQQANLSATAKFTVNLGSGLTAGVAAAILSQVRARCSLGKLQINSLASGIVSFRHPAGRHAPVADKQRPRTDGDHDDTPRRPRSASWLQRPLRGPGT